MTVDARIVSALSPFGDDVENAISHSTDRQYYAFNYTTIPTDFADDAPGHERYLVQVHFFAPLAANITARKLATKRALYTAGFTWPQETDATNENGRHIVLECEIAEGVDVDGDD